MLAHLEEQLDVDRNGQPLGGRLIRPTDEAAWNLIEAGGEGSAIAWSILFALRLAIKANQRPTLAGSAPSICRDLARLARELDAPALAADLECSGKAARAALRCAARRTCLIIEGRVRVSEVFATATAWIADHDKPLVPRHFGADSMLFEPDNYPELDVLGVLGACPTGQQNPVEGLAAEAREMGVPAVDGTSEPAGRGANPTCAPSCGVSLTTLVQQAPNQEPLTASAWILSVLALGSEWASRAAALVLDHERADAGPWSDARDLLVRQAERLQSRRPVRAPEVKNYARGLATLHESGLLQVDAGRWSKPRPALHSDLELYGIAPRPATTPMPAAGADRQLDIVRWMDGVLAPQDADDVTREGIDLDGMSQAEVDELRRLRTARRKAKLPKHGHLLDLMAAYNISREVFNARCLDGQAHGGYPAAMAEIRTMTAPMMREAARTRQSPHHSCRITGTRPSALALDPEPTDDEPSIEDRNAVASMFSDAWHEADLIEDHALAELPAVNDDHLEADAEWCSRLGTQARCLRA